MNMQEEILDLVSPDDIVIGQMERSMIYQKKLSNFRVVNAFVFNSQGQMWIPRRTAQKKLFPLCLDASMGGHVTSGETYQQAFERELLEELGFDAREVPYSVVGRLIPSHDGTSAFMIVYKVLADQVPCYNIKDFCEYMWIYPKDLIDKLNNGDVAKGDLEKIVKKLFL